LSGAQAQNERTDQMARSLKTLGLSLVAAFAMSAIVASAAQAAPEFTGTNGAGTYEHTIINGVQEGSLELNATAGNELFVKCETATFSATTATGKDTELTLFPTYKNCKASDLFTTHWRQNDCHYKFKITKTITKEKEYEGAFDLLCPAGKDVEIEMTKLFGGGKKCQVTILAQNGIGPVIYRNVVEKGVVHLVIELKATNVDNFVSPGGEECAGLTAGTHNGVYSGKITVKGEDVTKAPLNYGISGS
jgi:hypothetical protein